MAADGTYEHSDLVLATTIMMLADHDGEMTRRGNQVHWSYHPSERLSEVIADFRAGKCRVEPLAFAKSLKTMRQRVYVLLDYDPPRVRSSQPGNAS